MKLIALSNTIFLVKKTDLAKLIQEVVREELNNSEQVIT
jgi:hypothetical protein